MRNREWSKHWISIILAVLWLFAFYGTNLVTIINLGYLLESSPNPLIWVVFSALGAMYGVGIASADGPPWAPGIALVIPFVVALVWWPFVRGGNVYPEFFFLALVPVAHAAVAGPCAVVAWWLHRHTLKRRKTRPGSNSKASS